MITGASTVPGCVFVQWVTTLLLAFGGLFARSQLTFRDRRSHLECKFMLSAKIVAEGIQTLVVLSLCLDAAYGQPVHAPVSAVRYAPYIFEKADVFIRIDFGSLRKAKAFPELQANVKEGLVKFREDFLASTGVILDDVEVFVMIGLLESEPTVATGVMELKQPITERQLLERIHEATKSAGKEPPDLQTIEVAQRRVFVNPNAGSDQICLIDEKTLLIGTKGLVEEVLRRDKKAASQELLKAIGRLDFNKTLIAAAKAPPPKPDAIIPAANVNYVLVEGSVDELVSADVVLECGDEKQAEDTRVIAQALCSFLASAQGDWAYKPVFAGVEVTRDGKDVRISGNITPAQWNALWHEVMDETDTKEDGKDETNGGQDVVP